MTLPTLEVWFEFASTYSYPAVARVHALAATRGVSLAWSPFLLGPIFRAQGWDDSPFNLYPAKGRYMWRDLERICDRLGLPFRRPSVFPRNGLRAARVACVAAAEGWCEAFAPAVYRANFGEDRDVGRAEVLAEILTDLGRDAPALLARSESPEIRLALRTRTERATALGVFGAPSFVVPDAASGEAELFWGNDRLEEALEAAG